MKMFRCVALAFIFLCVGCNASSKMDTMKGKFEGQPAGATIHDDGSVTNAFTIQGTPLVVAEVTDTKARIANGSFATAQIGMRPDGTLFVQTPSDVEMVDVVISREGQPIFTAGSVSTQKSTVTEAMATLSSTLDERIRSAIRENNATERQKWEMTRDALIELFPELGDVLKGFLVP